MTFSRDDMYRICFYTFRNEVLKKEGKYDGSGWVSIMEVWR